MMVRSDDDVSEVTQYAWAVWFTEGSTEESASVLASDEETAIRFASAETGIDPDDADRVHVDGPFENSKPAFYEFIYMTEWRERVVVEAPSEDYAEEMADNKRTHKGDYVQTVHTEKSVQEKDCSGYHETDDDGGIDYEKERERCRSLFEFER